MDSSTNTAAAPSPEAAPQGEPGRKLEKVFISYASADSTFASQLTEELRAAGIRVWIAEDGIAPGEAWSKKIAKELQSSGAVILVVSPDSYDSNYVDKELHAAQAFNIPIIPVIHRPVGFWFEIGNLEHIDFTKVHSEGFARLIATTTATPQPPQAKPTEKKKCRYCSELIPLDALRCKYCGNYQGFRGFLQTYGILDLKNLIAVLTSLVIGAIYLYKCQAPSQTLFKVSATDSKAIVYVDISNKGWKKSYLRSYALEFGGLPIERRTLTLVSSDVGVVANGIPHGDVRIGLRVEGLRAKVKPGSKERYTKTEIKELTADNPVVTLKMEVQESGDPPTGPFHTKDYPFLINTIRELVLNKIPDEVPP